MSLKDALSKMKSKIESNEFKGSDKQSNKNNLAIIASNHIKPKKNKFPYTKEQEEIIESDADILKVRAFAGTGKTSTLEGYANRRTSKKGIYIAFNKDIKQEALRKFPNNVKCVTSHGLAFSRFGRLLQDKLDGYTNWEAIYSNVKVKKYFGEQENLNRVYSKLLQEVVTLFTNTAHETITIDHVLTDTYKGLSSNRSISNYLPSPKEIMVDAVSLWEAMIDPENYEIKATHDTYLKQFQLSQPVLNYDYILLDEAQDSNPALLDIFSRQETSKILVGDPYQSIYGFRNAVDAMDQISADKTLDLTMSFRFGEQIAEFANSVLGLRGETKQVLGMKDSDLVYYGNPFHEIGNTAFIGRYNSTILRNTIEYISLKNAPVYFAGGFESLKPNLLLDLFSMMTGRGFVKDEMLSTYKNYNDFVQMVNDTNDREWVGRCKLVEEYNNMPEIINMIRKRETKQMSNAGMIYSTAHKSKGLEFNNVILAEDFYNTPMAEGKVSDHLFQSNKVSNEELHIFYVAATRAKKTLNVSEVYRQFFMDYNRMTNRDMLAINKREERYPIIKNNPHFIEKLMCEREKAAEFYKQRKIDKSRLAKDELLDDPFL